jgi:hypothetical protein
MRSTWQWGSLDSSEARSSWSEIVSRRTSSALYPLGLTAALLRTGEFAPEELQRASPDYALEFIQGLAKWIDSDAFPACSPG